MNSIKHIIFRGDQTAYAQRDGKFPYIDHAAEAGATGVHIWFWAAPFRAVAKEFIAYCHDRKIGVHLGIGIGAYAVCDKQDPLDPAVMVKIKDHIQRTLDEFDIAGVEYQTGEYDRIEFKGETVKALTHAQQVCEHLNPFIDYIMKLKPSLWLRTELNAKFYPDDQIQQVAELMDKRCTVEWSRFTGPYRGLDCFDKGRSLLARSDAFSWFLKIMYNSATHWKEIVKETTPDQWRLWIEHWRGWLKLLDEFNRTTLTVCNVDKEYTDKALPMPAAAVALARNPAVPTEELMKRYFAG